MEKMPFRDENPAMDVQAVIEAASGASVTSTEWRTDCPR